MTKSMPSASSNVVPLIFVIYLVILVILSNFRYLVIIMCYGDITPYENVCIIAITKIRS